MPWARFDDNFPNHPKVSSLGIFAIGLQAAAICYCARYLTDGFMSYSAVDQVIAAALAPFTLPDGEVVTPAVTTARDAVTSREAQRTDVSKWDWKTRMIEAGLWERRSKGIYVHDYLLYNPSRASVRRKREASATRMAKQRQRKAAASYGVTSREVRASRTRPIETDPPLPPHGGAPTRSDVSSSPNGGGIPARAGDIARAEAERIGRRIFGPAADASASEPSAPPPLPGYAP
jgi:hypothetical protein